MVKILLMLFLVFSSSMALNAQIQGVIIDANTKEPIPGVSVLIKGTTTGAATSIDGKFSISAKKGDILQVSFIGYRTREINLASTEFLTVVLEPDEKMVDEVVVIGYGTQKKSVVTGAVASISSEELKERPYPNIIQTLQGAVAGMNIYLRGADAEGTSSVTRIRGVNSISGSKVPLIILDGVPYDGSWSELNVNDIESIEVLKDASSSAIYGARGASGVILIQTKRGKGEKLTVSYDGYVSFYNAINIPRLMDGETFYNTKVEGEGSISATEQASYEAGEYTDWLDLAMQDGVNQQHNISFRGSSGKTGYYVSANLTDNKGIALNDEFKKYSFRLNLDQQLGKWVSFSTQNRYGYYDRGGNAASFSSSFLMNPLGKAYYDDGSIRLQTWEDSSYADNPLSSLNEKDNDIERIFNSNNRINITTPVKGLSYQLNTGYTYGTRIEQTYWGEDTSEGVKSNGELEIGNKYDEDWLIENIVSFERSFEKHSLFITALYSAQKNMRTSNSIEAADFPNDVMTYWQPNKAGTVETDAGYSQNQHLSQMGRINYSYDSRYMSSFVIRRDGYSAFGKDHKYGIFPSVSLGWNMANEAFFLSSSLSDVVNTMKLRLSWGRNGNEGISAYSSLPTLDGVEYLDDDYNPAFGFYASALSSPDLGWETSESINLGLDFGLLRNRINGSVDVYSRKTKDLLLKRTIPAINGASSLLQNIGEMKGKGIEVQISSTNINRGKFRWSTNFNIEASKDEIVDVGLYNEDGKPIDDTASEWFIGYNPNVYYDYVFDGIFQVGEVPEDDPFNSQPGYMRYKDLNGDGDIDAENDKKVIGSLYPDFTFGMTNSFRYGPIILSVFINGNVGGIAHNYLLDTHSNSYRQNQLDKEFWSEDNPINTYPANTGDGSVNPAGADFYEKTDFLRIKDITLGYNFKKSVLEKLHLSKLEVYCNVQNLYTFTDWSGLDPEFVDSSSSQRAKPQVRTFLFGVKFDVK